VPEEASIVAAAAFITRLHCTNVQSPSLIANVRTCRMEWVAQAEGKITRRAGIIEANEQVVFASLPGDRDPTAGHPLRDLPPRRGVPARQPE
jgi:hypothetical protein